MKKGLFGFLAGVSLGGMVGLFSAKRKGSDLRKDLLKKWEEGDAGLDVLKKDLAGAAEELKKGAKEVYDNPKVKDFAAKAKQELSEKSKEAMKYVKETSEDLGENLKKSFEKDE